MFATQPSTLVPVRVDEPLDADLHDAELSSGSLLEQRAAPRDHDGDDDASSLLEDLGDRIDELERQIAAVAPLVHERARLLRARALILDEPEPDLRPRPRITRLDVFEYLTRNPGSRAGVIATALGAGRPAISAHLYRGKGKVFASRAGGWYPVPAADASVRSRPFG
ncbi:MAG TPA: hypothetical protein VKG89_04865 [Solirubrobacterales bacterium]|nr:hypothetical protein [Solirubrobacterales bacterium]